MNVVEWGVNPPAQFGGLPVSDEVDATTGEAIAEAVGERIGNAESGVDRGIWTHLERVNL